MKWRLAFLLFAAGAYSAACRDGVGMEKQGTSPLEPVLARVKAVASKGELFQLLGEHEAMALPGLFRFGSAPDMHDPRQTNASLGQGGLGLPERDDYLKDDAKSKEKRARYLEHVTRMLGLLGQSPEKAATDAQTVMRIETALASAHLDRVALRDPRNRDNLMTVGELAQLAPGFAWAAFFAATGAPPLARANLTSRHD